MKKTLAFLFLFFVITWIPAQVKVYEFPSEILTEKIIEKRLDEARNKGVQEWEVARLKEGLVRFMKRQQENIASGNSERQGPPQVQAACTNVDFEAGNYSGWTLTSGNINGVTLPCNTCASGAGGIAAVTTASNSGTTWANGVDNCTNQPALAPGGGNFSLCLNDNSTGGKMQEIKQTFSVTSSNNVFTYQYLAVLQDGGHAATDQPYFLSQMLDGSGNVIACTYVMQSAASSISGWTNAPNCPGVEYKGWVTVTLDLTSYIGQNVTIEFLVSDCNQGGHYGYCYIDADCSQIQVNNLVNICPGSTQLCGPSGFTTYSWTGPVTGNTMCLNTGTAGNYTLVTTGQCPAPTRYYTVTISPTPTVSFSSTVTPCNPTVPFIDQSTISGGATISNWSWDFGDGSAPVVSTTAGNTQNHTYPGLGSYNVVLTCTSSVGCVGTYSATVTIGGGPTAAFSATAVCPGNPTVFTNTSTGGTAYSWDFGDGSALNNSTSPTHVYASAGSYVTTLTVTGTGTCVATFSLTVTVNPGPTVTATGSSICNGGGPVNITAGGASTYTWDTGATGATVSVNPGSTTNYTVTGTDANGCVNTATTSVLVISNPTITVANTSICAGATATLSASGGSTYSWSGPNLGSTTGTTVTATPPSTSTYTIVGTIGTCTASTTATVTFNAAAAPAFTAPPVCFGAQTIYNNTSGPAGSTFNWDFGDGNSSTGTSPVNTYSAVGSYVTTLTVTTSSGCIGTTSVTVVVDPNPTPAFTSNQPCQGTAVTFNNTSLGNPVIATWGWAFGDGNTSTTQTPQNNYASAGIFTTVLTATTTSGCIGTFSASVIVHPNPVSSFSNTTVCLNTPPTNFTDQSTITNPAGINDNITTWAWAFGDGNTSTQQNPSNTYATCGTFNASLLVTTNNLCTNTFTLVVTVNCVPVLTPPANFTVCPNSTATPGPFVINMPGSTVVWNAGTTVTGIPNSSGTGNVPPYTTVAQNLSGGNISDVITSVPTSTAGCIGLPQTFTIYVFPTPLVNAMPGVTVCDQQQVVIPAFTSSPAGSTFTWNNALTSIGLGANGSGNIPPFIGLSNGSPTAVVSTVSVTPTLNGCVGPDSTFIITISPQPTVTLTSPPFTCPGNIVPAPTYTLNPNDPTTTFAWTNANINTGMAASGGPTIPGSFTAAANGTLANVTGVVTVIPTLGTCVGAPATYTVTIYPTPVINPIADVEYCPNVNTVTVNISMIPLSGGVQSYNWSSPNGASIGLTPTSGNTSLVQSFLTINAGTTLTSAQVIISGGLDGCPALPITYNITVNPDPTPSFAASTKVCEGSQMSFTDASSVGSGSITQWGWDFNNDGVFNDASLQNPQYLVTPAGTHTVGLTVTTAKGCKDTVTEVVYINYNPVPQFAGDVLMGCPIHPVNYTESSTVTGPAQIVSWNWSFGNGTSANTQTVSTVYYINTSPLQSAYYTASITVTTDSGCVNSVTKNNYITVYPHPQPGFNWGPQDPNPDVLNPVIYFVDQSVGAMGPNSYGPNGVLWYLGDVFLSDQNANYVDNVLNPVHTYEHYDPYIYNVTQWVQNTYGCKDSITKPVEIKSNFTFYIPNAFSPNTDGTNDGFKGTGIGIDNTTYNLWIFDRWGMQIFYANDMEKTWDGHIQGKDGDVVQEDVYVWKVKFHDFTGRIHEYKGTVSVIK